MSGKNENLKRRCLQEKYAQLEEKANEREKTLISRIDELRGEIGGYMETLEAMNAILTVAIKKTGPLVIPMEDVTEVMESGDYAVGEFNAEKKEYALHMPEGVRPDGKEEDVDVNASEQG